VCVRFTVLSPTYSYSHCAESEARSGVGSATLDSYPTDFDHPRGTTHLQGHPTMDLLYESDQNFGDIEDNDMGDLLESDVFHSHSMVSYCTFQMSGILYYCR
jgi:hypothetical protein